MMKVSPPFVRSPYNYSADDVSRETSLTCNDLSLTMQSEVADADINTMLERFNITGQLPQNVHVPMSGDFTGITSYHDAMNALIAADDAFMKLPADVRSRFGHDPQKLIEFVEDDRNREEAEKLGIVVSRPPQADNNAGGDLDAPAADGG